MLHSCTLHVHMPSYASCRLQSTKSLRSLPCEKKSGASLEALPLLFYKYACIHRILCVRVYTSTNKKKGARVWNAGGLSGVPERAVAARRGAYWCLPGLTPSHCTLLHLIY